MSHYVCDSCGGVSGKPGTCSTDGCDNKGGALGECDCSSDEHTGQVENGEDEDDEMDSDADDDDDDWEDDDEDDWN